MGENGRETAEGGEQEEEVEADLESLLSGSHPQINFIMIIIVYFLSSI